MFANLSQKLLKVLGNIGKRGILTEEIVESTIREIRVSLLEADVALSVVRTFSTNLKEKLIGQKVANSITPEQTVIKAVYDELVTLLGNEPDFQFKGRQIILMAGLQGTGKTTTSAKLANLLKSKFKKKVLLVSLDTYRPAAIEQLQKLAESNGLDFFYGFDEGDSPLDIAQKSLAVQKEFDVVIYDTAGRLAIDESMMREISEIKNIVKPNEVMLVIDSMMGQDAINVAKSFNELLELTGLVLTRVDGDARGGAALSAKSVTNCQIKFMCTGEKIGDIEPFHPERIASRILDKGDVLSLIEKAMDADIVDEVKDVSIGKNFDLNGMETYLRQMEKIGGISGFLKFIPGLGQIKDRIKQAGINDKVIDRQIALIRSMTPKERKNPDILNASRRKRIASGAGQSVSDVNNLIKQFQQIKGLMTKFQNPAALRSMMRR